MLPYNPKIGVHSYHLVMWGQFLFPLYLMVLVICCLPPSLNISIFLLCAQFDSLVPWIIMVACQSVSVSGHLQYMSFLVLDMDDALSLLVFYALIGAGILLHIIELICLDIFSNNTIS